MSAKKITTDASKAKLPRPKRKRPPNSAPKRVQCPRCEKLVLTGPLDIHTCSDAKALREAEARAVPCGEDMPPVIAVDWPWGGTITHAVTHTDTSDIPYIPPITEPFPWPVRLLNWLDAAPAAIRSWLARTLNAASIWLRRLAFKVTP